MTKSVSSLGIGIAWDKGLLDLDDQVISFFSDKLPDNPGDNLRSMTIRHLLTMTSGIHDNTYGVLYPEQNWVQAFLSQAFPHEPGTYYRYSTHASHMLSAIMEKVTGQSLLDFLEANLFSPMDIPRPQWELAPDGIIAGGMGLSLSPESIAKIGLLLLNKGIYAGIRIISGDYLALATSAQVTKQDEGKPYSGSQYGYQFHVGLDGCFRADGAFGQLCFISPAKNLVVVATSRSTNVEALLELVYNYFIHNHDLACDHSLYTGLQDKLESLAYEEPVCRGISSDVPTLNNRCYLIDENPNGVQQVIINQSNLFLLDFKLIYANGTVNELQFDFRHPLSGNSLFVKDIQMHRQRYVSYARWIAPTELELKVAYIETPYVVTYALSFEDSKILFGFAINVSFNLKSFTAAGRLRGSVPDDKSLCQAVMIKGQLM
ncbi:MAG: beta-lactamase [Paenibacillaceae bacterium]|jgi:hypothetical protein|nr:beta-lactamase [Paenibacillaceae bacterium]